MIEPSLSSPVIDVTVKRMLALFSALEFMLKYCPTWAALSAVSGFPPFTSVKPYTPVIVAPEPVA